MYHLPLILACKTTGRFVLYRCSSFSLSVDNHRWQFPLIAPGTGQSHSSLLNNYVRNRGLASPEDINWSVSRFGYVGWVDQEITPFTKQCEEFKWVQMFDLPENLMPTVKTATKTPAFLTLLSNPW